MHLCLHGRARVRGAQPDMDPDTDGPLSGRELGNAMSQMDREDPLVSTDDVTALRPRGDLERR